MEDEKLTTEVCLDEEEVDKFMDEALSCDAECMVGEVVECLLHMFGNVDESHMITNLRSKLSKEQNKEFDKFMISLVVSIAMTLVKNFKKRQKVVAKA